MSHEYQFLSDLNENQRYICISEENFILTACPGSGKTRTIVYRIGYMSEKYRDSKLINAAITYTNRAADEIESRLYEMGISNENIWSGTIHQFCLFFILRPYAMYHEKLCKGFKIIDEYVKEKYVTQVAAEMGIEGYINDLYENHDVMRGYNNLIEKNKEVDFERMLRYSLELVEQNDFIATNVGNLFRNIHVDEYQDTNELQYLVLSSLVRANRKINVLFVGDANQAIYRGLGGVAKSAEEIRTLFPIMFTEFCLDGCYRSTQRIVDYYVNFETIPTGVTSVSEICGDRSCISFNNKVHKDDLANIISKIIEFELTTGLSESDICVVAPQWYQLYPLAKKMRMLLPNVNFDAPDITPLKYDPLNVFFLIAKLLFTKYTGHRITRRKIAKEIIQIIREDYNIQLVDDIGNLDVLKAVNSTVHIKEDGLKTLANAIENLFSMMNIQMTNKLSIAFDEFFEKAQMRIEKYELEFSCDAIIKSFNEKKGIVISTIHGIKGEEYTTVIAFDLLNGHLPNWNYIYNSEMKSLRREDTNKLVYVLCSRAKKNLYLFSEKGRTTQKGSALTPTDEVAKCCFAYD